MNDKDKIKLIVDQLGHLVPAYSMFRSTIFGYIDYNMTDVQASMFLDQLFHVMDQIK